MENQSEPTVRREQEPSRQRAWLIRHVSDGSQWHCCCLDHAAALWTQMSKHERCRHAAPVPFNVSLRPTCGWCGEGPQGRVWARTHHAVVVTAILAAGRLFDGELGEIPSPWMQMAELSWCEAEGSILPVDVVARVEGRFRKQTPPTV